MLLLDLTDYDLLTDPLRKVTINNLFARAVIERRVTGSVYVDDKKNPGTFYVVHPYGMSLLFGDPDNQEFIKRFVNFILNKDGGRSKDHWMQVFPSEWNRMLNRLIEEYKLLVTNRPFKDSNEKMELFTRVNFKFNRKKYIEFRKSIKCDDHHIVRSGKSVYSEMNGSVVPGNFWDNEEDFFNNAVGFSLFIGKELISTAFSAFIHDNKLELGMETRKEFQGKGYAPLVCSALIDFCLQNSYEPIWACNLVNTGSYKLAQKLGFEVDYTVPYYKLNK